MMENLYAVLEEYLFKKRYSAFLRLRFVFFFQ